MKATDIIKRDHDAAKDLFAQFKAAAPEEREKMQHEVFAALTAHETMEDTYFYPALRDKDVEAADLFSELEGEQMKLEAEVTLVRSLPGDQSERIIGMMDAVLAHAAKEESTLLPRAEARMSEAELEELGAQMEPHSAVANKGT